MLVVDFILTSLDVDGHQVHANRFVWLLQQVARQFFTHELVNRLRGSFQQAGEKLVQGPGLKQGPRLSEELAQGVDARPPTAGQKEGQPIDKTGHRTVALTKGGRCKLNRDAWIQFGIVFVPIEVSLEQIELAQKTTLAPKQEGQILVENDMLQHGHVNVSGLMVNVVRGPMGVQSCQRLGQTIVLPCVDGVHNYQGQILVGSSVARPEAVQTRRPSHALFVGRLDLGRQQRLQLLLSEVVPGGQLAHASG